MSEWKKLEALLFASGKYLTEDQLIALSGIPKNKIKKALNDLTEIYKDRDTSLAVYNEADAWKLNVKEDYTDVIREVVSDAEMPRSVMETLAIIAYKSPVLQSEIKDMRGSAVYDHIPLLETKGFITREKHGRSYKLKLTNKFHDYFDIEGDTKLAELFKDVKKPQTPEKIGTLDVYTESEDDKFDNEILERMKKLEKTDEDHKNEHNFLNEFEEKFERTKKNIDESEQDVNNFKTTTEDSTTNLNEANTNNSATSENDSTENESENNMTNNNSPNNDEILKEDNLKRNDDKNDDAQVEDLTIKKEELFDEKGEPVSDFVDKINHQIDDLTKDSETAKENLNSQEEITNESLKESSNESVTENTYEGTKENKDMDIDESANDDTALADDNTKNQTSNEQTNNIEDDEEANPKNT